MEKKEFTEAEKIAYGAGIQKALDRVIYWLEKSIASAKARNPEPNTPAQIHNRVRLKAYSEILEKVKDKKENYQNHQIK